VRRTHLVLNRFFSTALAVLLLFLSIGSIPVKAVEDIPGPDICAETYCVINGDTKEIIISRNAEQKMFPASTTKVLTALIVLEQVDDLNQQLTFSETAINIDPSSSTLDPKAKVGETMTVKDALYGMLLQSANECGAMLGEFVAGSEAAFANLMNQKAAELGLVNSHFMNAYGIHDDNHYTCAYDLCLILRAAMQNERYRELNQTVQYTIPATNMSAARTFMVGHCMLNGTFQAEGVIGGKTGSTPQAGRTLVTAVKRGNLYTISSLMKSTTANMYTDEQVLLEYTYDCAYNPAAFVETNDIVKTTSCVYMRYSPTVKGSIFQTVDGDVELLRLGYYGNWSKVKYNDTIVYICSDFLQCESPVTPPETDSTSSSETGSEATTEASSETSSKASDETSTTAQQTATTIASSTETQTIQTQTTQIKNTSEEKTTISSSESEDDVTPGNLLDLLLILIPALIIALLIAIWIILFVQYRKKRHSRR